MIFIALTVCTPRGILYIQNFKGEIIMPQIQSQKRTRAQKRNNTTTVNVRVDETVKNNVEDLFGLMGMNISTAVNMFFKQCLAEGALPFQPKIKRYDTLNDVLLESQTQAKISGTSEMTLDEINEVIAEVRREA